MTSDATPHSVVELRNVRKAFGSVVVHRDISFSIGAGEVVTILGPSGTGKTVILKMIVGLLKPSSGEVHVFGEPVHSYNEDELQSIRGQIGMLFQGAALFDSLSVYENIAYSLRERGDKSEDEIEEIVCARLEVVDLPGIGTKYPPELSGGQKKRVGLARALASSPKILLFDEPTTGLDPTTCRLIDDLIIRLRDEFGITSIVVTHDIGSARKISNRWILLDSGLVVANGPVENVLEHSQEVIDFTSGNWESEVHLSEEQ